MHGGVAHIRRLKDGVKLGTEDDVTKAAHEIGHPHPDDTADMNLSAGNNGDPHNTKRLIDHLMSKGFHGIVHDDYSQADHSKNMPSLVLFNAHEHSEHVHTTDNHDEIDHHLKV
jgi:hypothetical protein